MCGRWAVIPSGSMLPTEVEDLLGSPGMEFWTSPASYDEVNGNTELDDNVDLISPELEEGKAKAG